MFINSFLTTKIKWNEGWFSTDSQVFISVIVWVLSSKQTFQITLLFNLMFNIEKCAQQEIRTCNGQQLKKGSASSLRFISVSKFSQPCVCTR